jgi:RimJ/RimL family protein N-acetyltransferase
VNSAVPIVLRTDRLVLSMPVGADADAVFAACQDVELQQYTTVPVPYTRADAEAFVGEYVPEAWAAGAEHVFGIRPHVDAPLWGVVSWQREREAVGYWLAAEHRGRGLMTEALRALLGWVFEHDQVERLRWEAYAGNLGSAIVAQRAGFRWRGEGPCSVAGRDGAHPWGWHGELQRAELGSVRPRREWPVLA